MRRFRRRRTRCPFMEFTVQPGETRDLGDIVIAKPQGRN